MAVYALMAQGRSRDALSQASKLVAEHPNFQLAHLVYGDLLAARVRPVQSVGDVPASLAQIAPNALVDLREESVKRVRAQSDKPKPGMIPAQFLAVSSKVRHAIAVDASRARLYLFENRASGLTLVADYYTSVGKAGVSKAVEGDQRTPLGVYHITSHLDGASLQDFYGYGALPINYPNALDTKRGKTGSGIWLHGTPSHQFARAPKASDGCLVMSNPDMRDLISKVEVGSTPVLIAPQLQWIEASKAAKERQPFEVTLQAWRDAKVEGNLDRLLAFYAEDFSSNGKSREQWSRVLHAELTKVKGRNLQLKDLTLLRWTDTSDTMVVTLGEVAAGDRSGATKRQYWSHQNGQWKIFFEGSM